MGFAKVRGRLFGGCMGTRGSGFLGVPNWTPNTYTHQDSQGILYTLTKEILMTTLFIGSLSTARKIRGVRIV